MWPPPTPTWATTNLDTGFNDAGRLRQREVMLRIRKADIANHPAQQPFVDPLHAGDGCDLFRVREHRLAHALVAVAERRRRIPNGARRSGGAGVPAAR